MIYSFRLNVSIQGNNYESAQKKFLKLVSKRYDKGFQKCITLCTVQKAIKGGEEFVSLDHVTTEKKDLMDKIEAIKPHNGLTPLEEFSVEQLQHHLSKLEAKLEKEVTEGVKRKLGWRKRGVS
jgi:hypothetical protein